MTYLDEIIRVLGTEDLPILFEEIMRRINKPSHKTPYMVDALKKGIRMKKIEMIQNPDVKTKYKGHAYRLSEEK